MNESRGVSRSNFLHWLLAAGPTTAGVTDCTMKGNVCYCDTVTVTCVVTKDVLNMGARHLGAPHIAGPQSNVNSHRNGRMV